MTIALFCLGAYLLGALPTGYLIVRRADGTDIRRRGSGGTGATNVLRLRGWRAALPVALIDLAKGFLPAFLALRLFGDARVAAAAASAAVVGHCFPVYIGFRGGKGVATAAGAMFALAWLPALLSLAVFAAVVAATRFVSLGSILAALAFPVFLAATGRPWPFIALCSPVLLVILIRHASNIGRLARGEERRLGRRAEPGS